MAFIRTCLKPNASYLSASGNPCTFNTGLGGHGKDLQKCVVSFMATQSGSGTPSPQNVRPFIGVRYLDTIVNETTISDDLGSVRYGGKLDLLTGKVTITFGIYDMGDIKWVYIISYANPYFQLSVPTSKNGTILVADSYNYVGYRGATSAGQMNNYECSSHQTTKSIYFRNDDYTDATDFRNAMRGHYILFELATPIELQLTPEVIRQIARENTISGGAEITNIEVDYLRIGPTSVSGMAESFKIPSVSYPEVTGNPITFDSEFALPLKKCVISFYEVSAISSIDVTVNGITTTISFGEPLTEGSVDVVSGILTRADSTTKQLTPTQLSTIVGTNTISTTGDSVSAKYIKVEP